MPTTNQRLKCAIVSPFHGGSHAYWAIGYQEYSKYDWDLYQLTDKYWKWRMYGSAIYLADLMNNSGISYDLILVTDMLDLAVFKSLLFKTQPNAKYLLYMHENQLTYPWSPDDPDPALGRDHHYGFTNYTSALIADRVLFNSDYHQQSFLSEVKSLLGKMPDYKSMHTVEQIRKKSEVVGIGIGMPSSTIIKTAETPRLLWNHRWEYDKNPSLFFDTLLAIAREGYAFEVVILGSRTSMIPKVFDHAMEQLTQQIIHAGFVDSRQEYLDLVSSCTHIPVTSNQDFFGISTVEAMAYGCIPLLPNRLAFPEHISPLDYPQYFYKTEEEFQTKLKGQLDNEYQYDHLQKLMSKYSWDRIAHELDEYCGF